MTDRNQWRDDGDIQKHIEGIERQIVSLSHSPITHARQISDLYQTRTKLMKLIEPPPYVEPAVKYRPAVMPDDYGKEAEFASSPNDEAFFTRKVCGYVDQTIQGERYWLADNGGLYPFCRIPVAPEGEAGKFADLKAKAEALTAQRLERLPPFEARVTPTSEHLAKAGWRLKCWVHNANPTDATRDEDWRERILIDIKKDHSFCFVTEETDAVAGLWRGGWKKCFIDAREQPPSAPVPELPEVDWDKAPEWAMWAAMDSDRMWHWYEDEPEFSGIGYYWVALRNIRKFEASPFKGDWTQSLMQRPQAKSQAEPIPAVDTSDKRVDAETGEGQVEWRDATRSDVGKIVTVVGENGGCVQRKLMAIKYICEVPEAKPKQNWDWDEAYIESAPPIPPHDALPSLEGWHKEFNKSVSPTQPESRPFNETVDRAEANGVLKHRDNQWMFWAGYGFLTPTEMRTIADELESRDRGQG